MPLQLICRNMHWIVTEFHENHDQSLFDSTLELYSPSMIVRHKKNENLVLSNSKLSSAGELIS